jgi:hypothetical protein
MKFLDLLLPLIMAILERLQKKQMEATASGAKVKKLTKAEVKAVMQEMLSEATK